MDVIFLDIDGVLNNDNRCRQKIDTMSLDLENIKQLKILVNATNAKIILCSDWRTGWKPANMYTEEDLTRNYCFWCKNLDIVLAENGLFIFGKTPQLLNSTRDEEIKSWLELNKSLNVENFVILDDSNDGELDKYAFTNLVLVYTSDGLVPKDVTEAIKILNSVVI